MLITESHILAPMILIIKRGVALILPFCLVWLFLACLAICSLHVEGQNLSEDYFSSNSFLVPGDSECCSVTDGQRSLLPERVNLSSNTLKGISVAFNYPTLTIRKGSYLSASELYSPSDPPFKPKSTLRI